MSVPPPPPRGRYARIPRKTRPPRTPKWWDRPLGAVLAVVGLALVVWIVVTYDGSAANLSKHVLGASFVLVVLVGTGLAFLLPKRAVSVWVAVLWTVPAALLWVGLEHWIDWHEFYNPSGSSRTNVTTPTDAKIRGTFFAFLGVVGLMLWVVLVRGVSKRRGTGSPI